MRRGLEREDLVFHTILEFMARHKYAPSVRDIKDAAGISSTSVVAYCLIGLERRGLIARDKRKSRAITLPVETATPQVSSR